MACIIIRLRKIFRISKKYTKLNYLKFIVAHIFLFTSLPADSQNNLLINGNFHHYQITKEETIDKWHEKHQVGVVIDNWEQNKCMARYNPKYSHENGAYLVATIFNYISKTDVQISNVVGQLCHLMIKENKYVISFYVKKFTGSGNSSSLSVCFSEENKENANYVEHAAFISNKRNKIDKCYTNSIKLSDADSFYHIQFTYQAKGGEQYIYIGNPELRMPSDFKKTKSYGYIKKVFSYSNWLMYAISDISVVSQDTLETCNTYNSASSSYIKNVTPNTIESVFEDVTFAYNKSELTLPYYKSLDSVAVILSKTKLSITIIGYTDDAGSVEYNQKLSELRAKSVADYLLSKGVNPKTVSYIGKGIYSQDVEPAQKRKVRYLIK